MSHTTNALTNILEAGVYKVHYKEYLSHKDEPTDNSLYDGPSNELNAEVLRSHYHQKRRFRRIARKIRNPH